jgi:tetratricopeptide (TPR) repeat protein
VNQENCPSPGELRRLLRGEVSGEEAAPLERHFAACSSCGKLAEALEAEDAPLRAPEGDGPDGEVIEQLMSRVQALLVSFGQMETWRQEQEREGALPSLDSYQTAWPGGAGSQAALPTVPGYEVLEELGRGAMGIVYRARQVGLDRVVALKMILTERARPEQLLRFQTEALAASRLQHPNIVQVYEVGVASGQPFLSLEFCAGGNLAQRLRDGPLPPAQAARLLEQVAVGVQAAHQAEVVHRDLKPANILLDSRAPGEDTTGLADCVPKISDFGLAKRLDVSDGQTQTGDLLGTPSYMAPEQAEGKLKEIGPATDVYALGAILYEMLTGRPPFRGSSIRETLELVCQADPVPPRQLQPRVPQDLETVCLKCLHKEPARRYGSAQELADDLGRFLRNEPVRARPVGRLERGWCWCRRNPSVAGLIAAVICVTATGFGLVSWQWQRALDREAAAHAARLEAEEAQEKALTMSQQNARLAEKERKARIRAEQMETEAKGASDRAQQSLDFLVSLFRVSDPTDFGGYFLRTGSERGRSLSAGDLLRRGADKLSRELKDQPLRASLLLTIGDVYRGLGLYDEAAPRLQEAAELLKKQWGTTHPDYARCLYHLGWLHLDRGNYDPAESFLREALRTQEAKLPADDPATVDTRMMLAWILSLDSDAQAIPLWKKVVAARTKRDGANHQQTMIAKGGLAAAYLDQGQMLEAAPLVLEMLPHTGSLEGGKTNLQAGNLFQQGMVAAALGLHARAQKYFEASLKLAQRQLGDDHYYLAVILHELAIALSRQAKTKEAEARLVQCLRVARHSVGLDHPRAVIAVRSYAKLLKEQNRLGEAKALWDESLAANEKRFGPDNRWRFFHLAPSAGLEAQCGNPSVAAARAREALRLLPRTRGKEEQKIGNLGEMGWALFRHQVDPALAETCFRQAVQLWRQQKEGDSRLLAWVLMRYGEMLHSLGRCREARSILKEAEEKGRGTSVVRGLDGYDLYRQLGDVQMAHGDFAEATRYYRKALGLGRKLPPALTEGRVVDVLVDLAGPPVEEKRWTDSAALLREAAFRGSGHPPVTYDNPLRYLALVQLAAGQSQEAGRTINTHAGLFREHPRPIARLLALRGLLVVAPTDPRLSESGPCLLAEVDDLQRQLAGNPAGEEVMALALLRLNQPAEVESLIERLPQGRVVGSPFWALCRAWAAALRGKVVEARKLYADAGKLALRWTAAPENADARAQQRWHDRLEFNLLLAQLRKHVLANGQ